MNDSRLVNKELHFCPSNLPYQTDNAVVSSEDVENFLSPSEMLNPPLDAASLPSTSSALVDPDFVGPPPAKVVRKKVHETTLHVTRDSWLERLHLAVGGTVSNGQMFRFMAATVQAGGGNLDEFAINEEWIRQKRISLDAENAKALKV